MRRALALAALATACAAGPPAPAALDTRNEACAWCRMAVSSQRSAGQLVAPSEEPRFFDDLDCLARYAAAHALPRGTIAYVADHRTQAWVRADRATYSRAPSLETPMASHLIAHADASSRAADAAAKGTVSVPGAELFGPAGPPGGME